MAGNSKVGRPGQFPEFRRVSLQRLEKASQAAVTRAAREALLQIRQRLGRLGNALGTGSDQTKGRSGKATPGGGYRTSGWIHVRSKSPRAVGAIQAATEGATILPVKGKWLWIATDEIPRRAGRKKMTPELYRSSGLESRIGPLEFIGGRHRGEALYIVHNVSVDRLGRRGRARRLPKHKRLAATRAKKDFIVAFVGIRNTARSRKVDPEAILRQAQARLPEYRAAALASIPK
jgi:hypothetical protein